MTPTKAYLNFLEKIKAMDKEEFATYLSSIDTIKNAPKKRKRLMRRV